MACVKLFAFFVKKMFFSIDTFCYDSLLQLCLFNRFPWRTEFLGVFGVFPLQSYYGCKLHFYFLFVSSTFTLLCISVNCNFYSRFVIHFSFYRICCVAQQLGNKEDLQQVKARSHSLVKLANLDVLQRTRVGNATKCLFTIWLNFSIAFGDSKDWELCLQSLSLNPLYTHRQNNKLIPSLK